MKSRLLLLAAAALCFCVPLRPAAQAPQQPTAQAPQQAPPNRGVQVGVPDGRGGVPAGRGRQAGPPAGPAPRAASRRVLLSGATPKQKGVWLPGGGGNQTATEGLRAPIPFQPWASGVLKDRQANQLEPHTRCKPSGVTRQFLTPYGVEIVELAELQRIYIFDIGGPHTYRTVYMDGRSHPAKPTPTYYGHSIGWWEGDTLVIDTMGFNESFWLDRRGSPHTEKLHTIERFTRTDSLTMRYEFTIDDPGAYNAPWTSSMNLRWEEGVELFEYQCQQANYAHTLMLGAMASVDRTSPIVP